MALTIRLIGAVLVALCGGSAGLYLCRRSTLRRKTLQQVLLLLQQLQNEIRYRKADLGVLYQQIQQNDQLNLLHIPAKGDFGTLIPPSCLSAEETACFIDCLSGLGLSVASQECDRLDYYWQRFSDFESDAAAEETQARQLYTRLGVGAGIMVAIALL